MFKTVFFLHDVKLLPLFWQGGEKFALLLIKTREISDLKTHIITKDGINAWD